MELSPLSRSNSESDTSHEDPARARKREYEQDDAEMAEGEEVELLRRQLRGRRATTLCTTRNLLASLLVGSVGFLLGGTIFHNEPADGFYAAATRLAATGRCNGYNEFGVLQVDLNVSRENKWIPLNSDCTPIDYLSKLALPHATPDLEFVRNKTVTMLGDSVDRGNLVHFCEFVGGNLTIIEPTNPRSPPLPLGFERPKFPGNLTYGDHNDTDWANNLNSRPTVCIIDKYNFKLTSTFIYGHQHEEDENESTEYFLRRRTHYYPPTNPQDRIVQITKPVLDAIGAGTPDLVTISPTFWDTFRHVMEDDHLVRSHRKTDPHGVWPELEAGATMRKSRRDTLAKRMEDIINFVGTTWSLDKDGKQTHEPTILWRTLHHTQPHRITPVSACQTADQIGRSIVQKVNKQRTIDRKDPIRLVDWGGHIMGQEKHSSDPIHPLALPSGWLWGNMFLDEMERDHARRQ